MWLFAAEVFADWGKALSHGWDEIQWLFLAGRSVAASPSPWHSCVLLVQNVVFIYKCALGFPLVFLFDFSHPGLQCDGCSIPSDSSGLLQWHVVYLVSYGFIFCFVSYINQFKSEEECALVHNCNIHRLHLLCAHYIHVVKLHLRKSWSNLNLIYIWV